MTIVLENAVGARLQHAHQFGRQGLREALASRRVT
jgi:hypothetical protein